MFNFYTAEGFRLFPCNIDKTPRVTSWRSSESHIDADSAERIASRGTFIGAWLPTNYVVIDVDRNHRAKDGALKPDGLPVFQDLCRQVGIEDDLTETTMVVKTGSGGMHLYFTLPDGTDYRTLSQKGIADSVDVRTHQGYVIAAGTNGYGLITDSPPQTLPLPLLELMQTRNKEEAPPYQPEKQLPVELLETVLGRIPATDFSSNDDWQEFVTACIAVAGNSAGVQDAIERWSRSDPNYAKDTTVRTRIASFAPSGGITAGTFIHVIRNAGVSKYLVDKVRMYVGASFDLSDKMVEDFNVPFRVDYDDMYEYRPQVEAYYYARYQISAVEIFARLVEGNLYYVGAERAFFYFDGNRWVEEQGILKTIYSVLANAMQHFYTDHSKTKDADADEYVSAILSYTSSYTVLSRFEGAIKQHPKVYRKAIPWDAPDLEATLTLRDCVMDFSGVGVKFRKGVREEFRLRYIDLCEDDFESKGSPEAFKAFLKDVFPNDETRKTATYALSTMLSGTGKFRKFQLWNGGGSNGKSTLMEIMKEVIGDRAVTYKPEVLLTRSFTQSLTPELAVFRGALVAFSSETEEAKRISQGHVKVMTGNETIVANPKYKDMIEFKTTFQLVLSTNYLPTFSAHDAAFIDRLLVLPFYTCFYKTEEQKERAKLKGSRYFVKARNPEEIVEAIRAERAQILYYLAMRYQELDISIPESAEALESKQHYVDDNDDIFKFLEDFLEYDLAPPNGLKYYFTPTKDLVTFYNEENNTKYSAKYVVMRLKEVYPHVDMTSKMVDGKLTRGFKGIRIKLGVYPEGWGGNYTTEEREKLKVEEAEF